MTHTRISRRVHPWPRAMKLANDYAWQMRSRLRVRGVRTIAGGWLYVIEPAPWRTP